MGKKIPNFNTFATIIDRLSIECVKQAHFENALEHDNPSDAEKKEIERKARAQREMVGELKNELISFMEEIFVSGNYEYVKEERTFK